jgi:hypothetical protein
MTVKSNAKVSQPPKGAESDPSTQHSLVAPKKVDKTREQALRNNMKYGDKYVCPKEKEKLSLECECNICPG